MLIFSARHLRTILTQYTAHYNGRRPHRSCELRPPRPDHPVADLTKAQIQRRPVLGELLSEYERLSGPAGRRQPPRRPARLADRGSPAAGAAKRNSHSG